MLLVLSDQVLLQEQVLALDYGGLGATRCWRLLPLIEAALIGVGRD